MKTTLRLPIAGVLGMHLGGCATLGNCQKEYEIICAPAGCEISVGSGVPGPALALETRVRGLFLQVRDLRRLVRPGVWRLRTAHATTTIDSATVARLVPRQLCLVVLV